MRFLLASGTVLVAMDDNGDSNVMGWGAVKQSRGFSMLTDLFVDPNHQAGGGAGLLGRLWPGGPQRPARFTFSSQRAAALPLYLRAGLVPGWPLLYLSRDPTGLTPREEMADLKA